MLSSIATRFVLMLIYLLVLNPYPALGQQTSAFAQDIVLLLDNSGSMKRNDPRFVTKEAVRQFVSRSPHPGRLALLLFDQEARLIVPLTVMSDPQREQILSSVDQINYRGLFTNIPAAFEQALYELKTNGRKDALKSIILLTDGIVDTGDKEHDLERARWLREELAADAARQGITVFGIGLGANSDMQLLQSLAQRTQGDYFRASKPDDLSAILLRIEKAMTQSQASRIALSETKTGKVTAPRKEAMEASRNVPIPTLKSKDLTPKNPSAASLPPPVPKPQQSAKPQPAAEVWPPDLRTLGLGAAALLLAAVAFSLFTRSRRYPSPEKAAPRSAERIPTGYLYDINGITDFERYELKGRVTQIGRIPPDQRETVEHIVIPLPTVGRRHAVLEYKHHTFWLVDQKSVNGTFVNGQRVFEEVCLKHGDRIRFHEAEFEFVQEGMDRADQTLVITRMKGALTGPDTARYGHAPIVSNWVKDSGAKDWVPDNADNQPGDHAYVNEKSAAKQIRDQECGHEFAEDLASKVRLATGEAVAEISPKKEGSPSERSPATTEHMHADKIKTAMESRDEDWRGRSQASESTQTPSLSGSPKEETMTRQIKRKVTDEGGGFEETLPAKRIAKGSWKDFFGN